MMTKSIAAGSCVVAGLLLTAGAAQGGGETPGTEFNGEHWISLPGYSEQDPFGHLPSAITLNGMVRDFRERSDSAGGHPDFERRPQGGFGHYQGMVADTLGSDGLPVLASMGYKVKGQAKDAQGRPILDGKDYIDGRSGDTPSRLNTSEGGAVTSEESFNSWFRDVGGLNMSRVYPITLVREANSNVYVFDDRDQAHFVQRGGFFPIDNDLLGNSGGDNKNFHFTYMLDTEFVYEAGGGQVFTFNGDDDVWVFIDGRLVIDIGGVHSRVKQTIELDRLNWLEDGEVYSLKFFFAERHRTQSNFRIETTMQLRTVDLPTATSLHD